MVDAASTFRKLLVGVALLLALPAEAAGQGTTVLLGEIRLTVAPVRHLAVINTRLAVDCGADCQEVTLQVSANTEWTLRIQAGPNHQILRAAELAPGLSAAAVADEALLIRGGRGGSQTIVLETDGSPETALLSYTFLDP